ncbi:hypothetical protein [Glycomyces salinus]|uniref:hypothetical protein n=1 Tax=Glycomyces salinus TaxID=980294 RepID=UPI0018ED5266|nr:hypothetical protein [Glycomyces salinus]
MNGKVIRVASVLFGSDAAIIDEADPALRMPLPLIPMMVAAMVMSGVLCVAGDTEGIMCAGLAGQLTVDIKAIEPATSIELMATRAAKHDRL